MKRRAFLKTMGLGAAASVLPRFASGKDKAAARPNIVLIMSDDMGYSDIGCFGGEMDTPVLNRLASYGLRFTHFYNTARCCPTRASLLTGLYPHQAGIGHMMYDGGLDGYRGDLGTDCVTIAEVMKTAGYATYMSGKWHVTRHIKPEGPKHNWPRQRGFDRFYGTITGAGSFYDPSTLTRDNTMIAPDSDPEYRPGQYYYTDAISDNAVRYIQEHKDKDGTRPFFMYVSYTAAHWPMHALKKDVDKYRGKYDEGYAAIRKARYKRMQKMGLLKKEWGLSQGPGNADNWSSAKNKDWEIRCMEVYAAMIDSMDQGIGRIVDALKARGQLDNTLILFLQDNGGCAEGLGRRPKGKYTERPDKPPFDPMPRGTLQRDMIPKQTRDGYPTIQGPGAMPGPDGTYIAYGRNWANVSNTPFREYKHWVHEGGIATPLIVNWPARIKQGGTFRHHPGHLIDIMATCVDVSGATYPAVYRDKKIQPMEGRSLAPAFDNLPIRREGLFWEHEGNRAIRRGRWKLVSKFIRKQKKWGPWELYDMAGDRSECNNLAEAMPDKVAELNRQWEAYARRARVYPSIWLKKQ